MAMLRSVNGLPHHGAGELGRVAHGALTGPSESAGWPRLFLGYNTLPDPPFPLVGYLQYELAQPGGLGLPALLRMMAESMRAQPVPPEDAFDESRRRVATAMRVDALVVVAPAHALAPAEGEGAWRPPAYREVPRRPAAAHREGAWEPAAALAVDREGARVLLVAGRSAEGGRIGPRRPAEEPDATLAGLLGEVLDAQHAWTKAAFAL
ncbi:hypothetical protein [Nonomuraea sp. NPDC049607]|uniref:hypothetical protein n=1 Tax=Nonomuraea sp. NPDC049607 TaxID=3154732 RepID=UPI003447EC74